MKQLIFLTFLLIQSFFLFAQNWTTSGNSGTNPSNDFLGTTDNFRLVIKVNNTEKLTVLPNGNFGIGISAPREKLDVMGNLIAGGQNSAYLIMGSNNNNYPYINTSTNPLLIGSSGVSSLNVYNNKVDILQNLNVSGNIYTGYKVLIGSTIPKAGNFSLAVNGEAIFNRAVVKLYGNWPDYVFEDNYQLEPLAEVEKFIKENKHLSGIEKNEFIKENGIDLGENQKQLLKKVEELTLYIIEQNKKIIKLSSEMELLKTKVN